MKPAPSPAKTNLGTPSTILANTPLRPFGIFLKLPPLYRRRRWMGVDGVQGHR